MINEKQQVDLSPFGFTRPSLKPRSDSYSVIARRRFIVLRLAENNESSIQHYSEYMFSRQATYPIIISRGFID